MAIDENITLLPKNQAPVPKIAIAAIVVLVASVAGMIYIRSKPNSSQEAVPGRELVIGVDRATLYVPADAATLAGVISIVSLDSNSYAEAGEEPEWLRSQVVDINYLNQQGTPYANVTFPKPVLICFMIKELWQDYVQHPDEYDVQYYAEDLDPPAWVSLPVSANADRYQLCGQTDHLSIFALAVVPGKEIPLTGGTLAPTPTGFLSATPTPNPAFSPTPTRHDGSGPTPVSTQAALTATSVALTATDVPPTNIPPTNIPPTSVPPTAIPPTIAPPTDIPATIAPPTDPPATDPPATDPPATDPPATDPPAVEPPAATDPPGG
jgi:hypothetical protein